MGKLHTIKRAILQNPEKFMFRYSNGGKKIQYKALFYNKGKIIPSDWYWCKSSYKSVVKFLLAPVGMSDDKG